MQIIDLVPDLRPTILAARELRDARLTLEQFFPLRNTASIKYNLGRRKRYDQTVPIRAFDAPAVPILLPGVSTAQGDLPALTPRIDLTEDDLNKEMHIAQQLLGQSVDWQPSLTVAAGNVTATIHNSLEVMRGQLLGTGFISLLSADGYTRSVDFGIPAGQIITSGAQWSTMTPQQVLASYTAGHEAFISAYGEQADVALTTRAKYAQLLNAVQGVFPNAPVGQQGMEAYFADRGLPMPVTYDRRLDQAGTKVPVFPANTVTFLPAGAVGETQLGVTQDAVQQVSRVQPNGQTALRSSEAAGITVVTLGKDDPVQRSVKGSAIGMPVMGDVDNIVILKGV